MARLGGMDKIGGCACACESCRNLAADVTRFTNTRDNHAALCFEDQLDYFGEIFGQGFDHFKDRVCLSLEHTAGRANNG